MTAGLIEQPPHRAADQRPTRTRAHERLLFVDKGIGKLRVEDFPYDRLSSIQYETGWMMGTITSFASGNRLCAAKSLATKSSR